MAARAFLKERSAALGKSCPDEDGRSLAQAIVDTIRQPLLVLAEDLRARGLSARLPSAERAGI